MRALLAAARLVQLLAAADLVTILLTGRYTVPFTALRSAHPCTSLFAILCLELARRALAARRDRRSARPAGSDGFLFLLAWAGYLANFRWRGSGDVVGASVLPFSLLREGNVHLDEFAATFLSAEYTGRYEFGGHLVTKYSSAAGLFLVPFYAPSVLAGVEPTDLLLHQLQKIAASCIVAASMILLLRTLERFAARRWAVTLAIGYAFGTSSFSTSSQAIWQHGPAQLCVALGLWLLAWPEGAPPPAPPGRRRFPRWERRAGHPLVAAAAGFAFALAAWVRYPNLLLYAAVAAWFALRARRALPAFLAGSLAPFAAMAADNLLHSGSLFATGYRAEARRFDMPLLEGLGGLLASPGRGLLLFSPFLLFGAIGLAIAWSRPGRTLLRALSLGAAAITLLYASWHAWNGGWCFGPRFLADLLPVAVLAIVPATPWLSRSAPARIAFGATLALSVLVHLVGAVFTWWWEEVPGFWTWDRHPVGYLLRLAPAAGRPDQLTARWIVIALLAGIAGWTALAARRAAGRSGAGRRLRSTSSIARRRSRVIAPPTEGPAAPPAPASAGGRSRGTA